MEATTTAVATATKRKKPRRELKGEQKQRFIAYFMRRYPATKKIKVGTNGNRAYTARAYYRINDANRTIVISAYTYETLVIRMKETYSARGLQATL